MLQMTPSRRRLLNATFGSMAGLGAVENNIRQALFYNGETEDFILITLAFADFTL